MFGTLNNKIYRKDYYGYVYIWYDTKNKKYLIGSHHGACNMKYKTSTGGKYVKNIFKSRPHTMKYKILDINNIEDDYRVTRKLEQKWLNLRPNICNNKRYYNISQNAYGIDSMRSSAIQRQRVKNGTHAFLYGTVQKKLLKQGRHYFQSSRHKQKISLQNRMLAQQNLHPVQKMVKAGTHHWLGGKMQRERNLQLVKKGKHIFQSEAHRKKISFLSKQKILNKTHIFCTPNFNGKPFKIICNSGKSWTYDSKVQAVKDGFPAHIIDNLRKNNTWAAKKPTNTTKKHRFMPGDTLHYIAINK